MSSKLFTRKSKNLKPLKSFLIVCEGEKTETNYFKILSEDKYAIDLKIIGAGCETLNVVKRAIEEVKKSKNKFDEVWAVFDRDDVSTERIIDARKLAAANEIKIAYSNESFELWLLLHFEYIDSQISRTQYIPKLTSSLTKLNEGKTLKYNKNELDLFKRFMPLTGEAIKNSRRLHEWHTSEKNIPIHEIERMAPISLVYVLVESILENARD